MVTQYELPNEQQELNNERLSLLHKEMEKYKKRKRHKPQAVRRVNRSMIFEQSKCVSVLCCCDDDDDDKDEDDEEAIVFEVMVRGSMLANRSGRTNDSAML